METNHELAKKIVAMKIFYNATVLGKKDYHPIDTVPALEQRETHELHSMIQILHHAIVDDAAANGTCPDNEAYLKVQKTIKQCSDELAEMEKQDDKDKELIRRKRDELFFLIKRLSWEGMQIYDAFAKPQITELITMIEG